MSIVPVDRVTVCGYLMDKPRVLDDLQSIGCLHLIPLTPEGAAIVARGPSPEAREALKYLLSSPQKRHQVRDPAQFDALAVGRRAREIKERVENLEDERDFLIKRIADLKPWGEFRFPPVTALKGQRLWFYVVPHHEMEKVEATDLVWETVSRDNRFAYVVVISKDEPQGMPAARTHTGAKPLSQLEERRDGVELEIEDLQAERAGLTRWCRLFAADLDRLEDRAAFLDAFQETYDQGSLFAVQGWAPRDRVPELERYVEEGHVLLDVQQPEPGDEPPTLFRNSPRVASGEDLVSFYMTPSYWFWDPSGVVLFSFAIFFAMIICDAGYAALMALGLVLGWQTMGGSYTGRRLRRTFTYLVGASLIWGVLVGSYFGVSPEEGSFLAALKVLDINNTQMMMQLSVLIGVAHIAIANLAEARRRRGSALALASLGWVAMLGGGVLLGAAASGAGPAAELQNAGYGVLALGGAAVLLFTGAGASPGSRLFQGLQGLFQITKAFGDVMSYLRLFALGLASASLAIAFNNLARQISEAVPGLGLLLALLVLLVGHAMNFGLSIVSGFVHGLRLNVIEFFNWCITEEGRPFRAFEKKEAVKWTN